MPTWDRPHTPHDVALPDDQLDLWLVRQPRTEEGVQALAVAELDDRERDRAASFIRPPDRVLYTAAHIALRRLLGSYLGTAPRDVRFFREPCPGCGDPHGRPAVEGPLGTRPPLHFSLSHSSGLALVGVAGAPLGVDVEKLPAVDTISVCAPALHPGERAELEALEDDQARRWAFGQLWTRKEAYLKGIGTGLSRALSADYLGAGGEGAPPTPPGWTIIDIPGAPADATSTHAAAVVIKGPKPRTTTVRWLSAEWLHTRDTTSPLEEMVREKAAA